MKKVTLLVIAFFLIGTSSRAINSVYESSSSYTYDGSAYIFIENGVEFSIFPDGQFDFVYVGHNSDETIDIYSNNSEVNINFNSGYNYDTYVQYDDYGAVIQVENVEIYYDGYGRITQAGSTVIRYNDRRIVRVGGLRVFYNPYGYFSHYTGAINFWTPYYIYRPWHIFYVRPFYSSCIVYDYPYRTHYRPHRYSYHHHRQYYNNRHRTAYRNGRRNFHRPGSRVHYSDGRVATRNDFNPNRRSSNASANPTRSSASISRNKSHKRSDRSRTNSINRSTSISRAKTTRNSTRVKSTKPVIKSQRTEHSKRKSTIRVATNKRVSASNNARSNTQTNKRNSNRRSTVSSRSRGK